VSAIRSPRPFAVGSIAETFARYARDCDVVVRGTPIDLARLIRSRHPIRHPTYRLEEAGGVLLADALEPIVAAAGGVRPLGAV
jgi:predicted GTPase